MVFGYWLLIIGVDKVQHSPTHDQLIYAMMVPDQDENDVVLETS